MRKVFIRLFHLILFRNNRKIRLVKLSKNFAGARGRRIRRYSRVIFCDLITASEQEQTLVPGDVPQEWLYQHMVGTKGIIIDP